ncbi:MAG: GNAT family N-acetyltransferase [Nocardioides sp.]
MVDSDLVRAAELGEAEYMYRFFAQADDGTREALGMAQARIGGGVCTVMAHDPTGGFWNRTIGLGVTEPLTRSVLDEVCDFVRANGGPSTVFQVSPRAHPAGWDDLLADAGATPGSAWVKFAGDTRDRPDVPTDLRLGVLGPEDSEAYAHVMCAGFGMPLDSPLPAWFARVPAWHEAGFTTYGAWDGDDLVAAATLLTFDDIGSLCGAATLPAHRGRGAQGALMVRRIRDAASAGCTTVVTETGAETPEEPNPSLHNMRRLGLTELYERRNWIWRAG